MDGTLAERERKRGREREKERERERGGGEIKEGFLPYTNLKELPQLCRDRNTTIRYYSDDIV